MVAAATLNHATTQCPTLLRTLIPAPDRDLHPEILDPIIPPVRVWMVDPRRTLRGGKRVLTVAAIGNPPVPFAPKLLATVSC